LFDFLTSRKEFKVDPRIFMRPDIEFIRQSIYACAKLIVDEEAHGTLNQIVELNNDGFYTKTTQKGGFSFV
jgi:hypothetical protein